MSLQFPNYTPKFRQFNPEEYRKAAAHCARQGLIQVPKDASPFLHAVRVRPGPKPHRENDGVKCPECGRMMFTRDIGGSQHFIFHRTSEFPQAKTCGMSGQKI
jgi:hypothetical protein